MTATEKTLELEGPLSNVTSSDLPGGGPTQDGAFYYEVFLRFNDLYDEPVLRSESSPVAAEMENGAPGEDLPVIRLAEQEAYFPSITEEMTVSFNYDFRCPGLLSSPAEQVYVDLIVEQPGLWSRRMPLLLPQEQSGGFRVSVPLDIHMIQRLVDVVRRELQTAGAAYDILLEAGVDVSGSTGEIAVRDAQVFSLAGHVEGGVLKFEEQEDMVRPGTAMAEPSNAGPASSPWSSPWLFALVVAAAALGLLAWNEFSLRQARLSPVQVTDRHVRMKYGALIIDIAEMPERTAGGARVTLNSPDELARLAEDINKPIFRMYEPRGQWLGVIDGASVYEYVIARDVSTPGRSRDTP